MRKPVRHIACLLPMVLALASQAQAQTPQSNGSSTAADDNGQLEDVIVTAQQRGENLQRAALPLSVVTGDDLRRAGIAGLDSLEKNVPALQVQNGAIGNLVFIRGVGSFSIAQTSDPAAAFNYDGVYVGRSVSTTGAFYDLERVEVLKGPQGTLYGRNATAGAINILPVEPRLGELSGYATVGYGDYNAVSAEGAINLPAGSRAGLRLSGIYSGHDGYLNDGTSSDRSLGLRAQLKVELDPRLTVRIGADYAHSGGTATGSSYLGRFAFNPTTGTFVYTSANLPIAEGLYTAAAQAFRRTGVAGTIAGRLNDSLAEPQYVDADIYGVTGHFDYQTSIGTISLIPAWRRTQRDTIQVNPAQLIGNTTESDQTSVELRLVSPTGGMIDYILGAYYFSEDIADDVHNTTGASGSFTYSTIKTRSPAAYGRLTLHATDRLRLSGGLRYTHDSKTFDASARALQVLCTIPAASGGCPTVPLVPYTRTFEQQPIQPAANLATVPLSGGGLLRRADTVSTGRFSQGKLTYRGAIEFDVAPRSLLYASYETGYRAGGFNTDTPYGAENIAAYTIGSKNRFFGNRLQLNIEGFYWKYRDQQLAYLGINSVGSVALLTRNIGRSVAQGVEVEAVGQVTPTTRISANVQYSDTKYNSFTYSTPARPYTGCPTTVSGPLFVVDCAGFPLYNAPRWTVNLGAQQSFALGGGAQLVLDADTQYRSSRYTSFTFTEQDLQGGNWISNAQASLLLDDGRWSIAAFVRNIENDRYKTFATPVPASNLYVSIVAPPRTYGVKLGTRF